jgi:hypothetical protein
VRRAMSAVQPGGDLEHLVFKITQVVWGDTSEGFLRSLVRQLSRALDADLVLVGGLTAGGKRIRTLAIHSAGGEIPAFEYDLAGTPCAGVVEKYTCSYADDVQSLFPSDTQLVEMGAQGYVGAPLLASSGRCLGLLCAITARRWRTQSWRRRCCRFSRNARRRSWSVSNSKRRWRTAKNAGAGLSRMATKPS